MARASILWLIGEYCHLIPKIAPDVLRKAAKTFVSEVQCSVYMFKYRIAGFICEVLNCANYARGFELA